MMIRVLVTASLLLTFGCASQSTLGGGNVAKQVRVEKVDESSFDDFVLIDATLDDGKSVVLLSKRVSDDSVVAMQSGGMLMKRGQLLDVRLNQMDFPVVGRRVVEERPSRGGPTVAYTLTDDDFDNLRVVWYSDTFRTVVYMSPDIHGRYYLRRE